jgi:uncharacterized protein
MDVRRTNRLVSMLLDEMKGMTDEGRDLPVRWNVMHMFSSSQLAKVLALRRGIDIEMASLAAALHDIAVAESGKTEGHAQLAEQRVRDAILRYNSGPWVRLPKVTKAEEDMLVHAIIQHSDKAVFTDDPLVELLKDVDSLDRCLYGVKTEGAYLDRCNKVLRELGIEPRTDVLEGTQSPSSSSGRV